MKHPFSFFLETILIVILCTFSCYKGNAQGESYVQVSGGQAFPDKIETISSGSSSIVWGADVTGTDVISISKSIEFGLQRETKRKVFWEIGLLSYSSYRSSTVKYFHSDGTSHSGFPSDFDGLNVRQSKNLSIPIKLGYVFFIRLRLCRKLVFILQKFLKEKI